MSRKKILTLIFLVLIPTALATTLVISNVFRGVIYVEQSGEQFKSLYVSVYAPSNVTVGENFTMLLNITNPNGFAVNATVNIKFTLINATNVTYASLTHLGNNFTYYGEPINVIFVANSTWKFSTKVVVIDAGTHLYRVDFQLNENCTKLEYEVWLTNP